MFRYLSPPGRPLAGSVNDPGKTHLCLEAEELDDLLATLQAAGNGVHDHDGAAPGLPHSTRYRSGQPRAVAPWLEVAPAVPRPAFWRARW